MQYPYKEGSLEPPFKMADVLIADTPTALVIASFMRNICSLTFMADVHSDGEVDAVAISQLTH